MEAMLAILEPLAAGRERYLQRGMHQGRVPEDIPAFVPDERVPVYKTWLCDRYLEGSCRRGARCWFAHGRHELRRYGHYGSRR